MILKEEITMQKSTAILKLVEGIEGMIATDPYPNICKDVIVKAGHEDCDVLLSYDGAGYDYLSMESDLPYLLADEGIDCSNWDGPPLRKQIIKFAERLGFHAEDCNNWSMGFWFEG